MENWLSDHFEFPEPYTDGLTSVVEVHFGWRDRLRLLFGGVVIVSTRTMVEHTPGRMASASTVEIPRPGWISRLRHGRLEFGVVEAWSDDRP